MSAVTSWAEVKPPAIRLVTASTFTIEQLTNAYNQTRVDYLVPMPMNAARLAEYIYLYHVDLEASFVALEGETMRGLGMLAERGKRGWITRLGVIPATRRQGVGRALVEALLHMSRQRRQATLQLEVIRNNEPAYNLFAQAGFQPAHELLVLRRPPATSTLEPQGNAKWLGRDETLKLLAERDDLTTWITETASLARVDQLQALLVAAPDGSSGWLVFHEQKFRGLSLMLSRLVLRTLHGEPERVAGNLLAHLYRRFPDLDTQVENIAVADPHLPALRAFGFIESFRRIELRRTLTVV